MSKIQIMIVIIFIFFSIEIYKMFIYSFFCIFK